LQEIIRYLKFKPRSIVITLSLILIIYGIVNIFAWIILPLVPSPNPSPEIIVRIAFIIISFFYLVSGLGVLREKLWGFFLSIILPILMIIIGMSRNIDVFLHSRTIDEGLTLIFIIPNIFILPFSLYVANYPRSSYVHKYGDKALRLFQTILIVSLMVTISIQSIVLYYFEDAFYIASLSLTLWALFFGFLKLFK
ncbi:MAG: hypothetical protein ACFFDN_35185, partial [Candidatus Hodarchaeota archaeon]